MNERVDMMRNTNVTEQGNPSWETYFPKTVDDAVMITNDQGNIPNTEAQTLKEKLADMSNASGLTVKDTEGMLGEALKNVNLQTLIDTIADKVLNELMAKSQIATSIENSDSTVPASSLLYQLNSDMQNKARGYLDIQGSNKFVGFVVGEYNPSILINPVEKFLRLQFTDNDNQSKIYDYQLIENADFQNMIQALYVTASAPGQNGRVSVTAAVPEGYKFLCWLQSITSGWVGNCNPSTQLATTDFYTSVGSGGTLRCWYLVIKT